MPIVSTYPTKNAQGFESSQSTNDMFGGRQMVLEKSEMTRFINHPTKRRATRGSVGTVVGPKADSLAVERLVAPIVSSSLLDLERMATLSR